MTILFSSVFPLRQLAAAVLCLSAAALACAQDLPPLAPEAQGAPNPYRDNAEVLAAGQAGYQLHCAHCHGDQSARAMAEAPDLRRLDSFCRRLKDPQLASHCRRDVDSYYLISVREGKVRAGVVHMPPWKAVLTAQEIWAIRSFIETRPQDPPRRTTSVDAARAAEATAKR